MFHHLTPTNINKDLLLDCRRTILKTIENNIPLNESPSFFYCPQGGMNYVFSTEEQKNLTQRINEALAWGREFTCCLCLKTKEGYGFVLIEIEDCMVRAFYQKPPSLKTTMYSFEKPKEIKNPLLALSFLFRDNNVVYH